MQPATTGTVHRVLLLQDASDATLYKARPAYLPVMPGDKVRFVNYTHGDVLLRFTQGNVFDAGEIVIGSGSGANSTDLSVVNPANGRYPYTGTVTANGQQHALMGESSPEIIIDGQ